MFYFKFLKKKNFYFTYNNIISNYKKNIIWNFFYSGFYLDDIFSKIIKYVFNKLFNIYSFFILDKWFSNWTGSGLFKNIIKNFNKIIYFNSFNYLTFLIFIISSIPLFFFFIFIIVNWLF